MAAKDLRGRLIDNIGRQIRRLNAREKAGGLDEFQLKGLNRQRDNLKEFRDEVKKLKKTDTVELQKAQSDYKNNGNYTTSQSEIDKNTKRLLGGEIGGGAGPEPEPESTYEPDDSSGGSTIMDQFSDLFEDMARLNGLYIGRYADEEIRAQAQQIIDKISEMKNGDLEITEEQRQQLDHIASDIEGRMNAKGNYSVRDTSGKIVGYEATFEMENYVDGIEEMTRGNSFDIKEWIRQNEGLFPETQDHPGWKSFEERFEEATKGLNEDYEW